jgi:glycosyltransferase involved in cell wall biosynthesis
MGRGRRVLLFTELGAASRFWEGSATRLMAAGWGVVVATLRRRGPLHEALEARGCPTIALDCRNSRGYPWAAARLAGEIARRGIDVVHSCESIPATIGGVAAVLAGRGRRVFHRQHDRVEGPQAVFSRIASRLAHMVIACSNSTARHAHECDGVPYPRIRVAYNAAGDMRVPGPDELRGLRNRLGIPSHASIVSIVARLRPEKGHRVLIDALALVSARLGKSPHLIVVGSGVEEGGLREYARAQERVLVHFVGHQEDVALWFSIADVVAMPSLSEPFGIAAVEAMACARPLVASRVGGLVEVVEDGVSGLLVEPSDPSALADGLLRLLLDQSLASRLSQGARERASLFSMESMVQAWLDCYEEVLSGLRLARAAGPVGAGEALANPGTSSWGGQP